MSKPFAVFDIDGTLIRWQLFHAIVHSLGKTSQLGAGDFEAINAARLAWKNRGTPEGFHAYEQELVDRFLAALPQVDPNAYDAACQAVFREYKDQTFRYTRNLIQRLKGEGYLLFAISGSPQEVVSLLAQHHGFDDAIGCTFGRENGRFNGDVHTPTFDKKSALDTLVEKHSTTYEESYAVGDSTSDAPMLAAVTHPIAFCPDQQLYDIAKAHSWPIVVERKNVIYEL